MVAILALIALIVFAGSTEARQLAPADCAESVRASRSAPYTLPPPVFIRRSEAPRLMIFVHGLHGDGTSSWQSRNGTNWPALAAQDPAFADFDIFVHEYVLRATGAVPLGEATERFVQVASQHGLVSQYRDVVFVTEGDGVYYIRELLRRVPPFAARATMVFVAGRADETAASAKTDALKIIDGNELLSWPDFMSRQSAYWASLERKPWIHCAVLGRSREGTVPRDSKSSYCSTMPLALEGDDWRSLRPSCFADPVHQALRRSVSQYALPVTQTKAAPASTVSASSRVAVPCQVAMDQLLEIPLAFNADKEDVISAEAIVTDTSRLKAWRASIQKIVGNVAYIRYLIAGLDVFSSDNLSASVPTPKVACAGGEATITVNVLKRPKG